MTTITEDYVSFDTAKLLKGKKFNYPCRVVYSPKGIIKHYLKEEVYAHHLKGHKKLCPTLQMAMKWLREVHNIFIDISPIHNMKEKTIHFIWQIFDSNYDCIGDCEIFYNNYEQAAEAAIKYCIENLI